MPVTQSDVNRAIKAFGLEHKPICLHSSFRSFGPVAGGPQAVINAFLDAGCTLLVPTFSHEAFAIAPPAHLQVAHNGWDYGYQPSRPARPQTIYTPECSDIDADMGALPAAVLAIPEHVRGDHPLNSFTAVGSLARTLVSIQRPEHVYGPLEHLSELGGFVILAGVGLTRMTLLHLAEAQAGRTLFRRWALGSDGKALAAETGGCSEGFKKLAPALAPYVRHAQVGPSHWHLFHAAEVLEVAAEAIRADPAITYCDDPACERCRDTLAGGPNLP